MLKPLIMKAFLPEMLASANPADTLIAPLTMESHYEALLSSLSEKLVFMPAEVEHTYQRPEIHVALAVRTYDGDDYEAPGEYLVYNDWQTPNQAQPATPFFVEQVGMHDLVMEQYIFPHLHPTLMQAITRLTIGMLPNVKVTEKAQQMKMDLNLVVANHSFPFCVLKNTPGKSPRLTIVYLLLLDTKTKDVEVMYSSEYPGIQLLPLDEVSESETGLKILHDLETFYQDIIVQGRKQAAEHEAKVAKEKEALAADEARLHAEDGGTDHRRMEVTSVDNPEEAGHWIHYTDKDGNPARRRETGYLSREEKEAILQAKLDKGDSILDDEPNA